MNQSPSPTAANLHQPHQRATTADWRADVVLLGCVLVGVLLLRLPAMALPLERDEGAYAYVASVWLQGGLPYRDAFDHKPPLIYLLYMPPLLVPLPPVLAIRLWSTMLCLLNTMLVFVIARYVWPRPTALLAALIFGVAGSAFALQGLILNTDQALVLPTLLLLWVAVLLLPAPRLRYAVALGAVVTAALLIKPVAVVLAPVVLLACLYQRRDAARLLLGVVGGSAALAVPVIAYFWARGGLPDLLLGVVTYNRLYAVEAQARWQLGLLIDMSVPFVPLVLGALGGVVLLGRRPPLARRAGWLVIAWTAALLAAALGSLRPFIHYYYPLLPGLALLAAPCISWLWTYRRTNGAAVRRGDRVAAVLLAALLIGPLAVSNIRLLGTTAEQQATWLYGDAGQHYFAPAPQVAAFVRRHTQPNDYIYVWAAEPQVYLLAERRSSSRFIYDFPLGLLPQAPAELRGDLGARPPKLMITYVGVTPNMLAADPYLNGFSRLAQIGGFEVWGAE